MVTVFTGIEHVLLTTGPACTDMDSVRRIELRGRVITMRADAEEDCEGNMSSAGTIFLVLSIVIGRFSA